MAFNRWTHSNKAIYNLGYHLIWCPKYRKKILIGKIEQKLRKLLNDKAKELNMKIEIMEILPDHVHLFIKADPTLGVHFIVQQLKGYTSNLMRKEFLELRKLPTLWTRSYYCESVGHISEDTVKKYIEDQIGE